jgi:hypothetical protein
MQQDNQAESIEASRKAQLLLVGVLVLLAAVYFPVISELRGLQPAPDASPQEIDRSIAAFEQLANYLIIIIVAQSLLFSLWLGRIAGKARACGKFPPPGTWVLKKTRIVTGDSVKRKIAGTYLAAVLVWFPLLLPLSMKWMLG